MRRILCVLALLSSSLSAMAGPVATNLLVNGGFESTPVANASWRNIQHIAGWSVLAGPGSGFEVRNNAAGAAQEGDNYLELDTDGNTTIGQSLTNLVAGLAYDLSFWYSPRIGQSAATNGINAYWNGVQLGTTFTSDGGSTNLWTEYQFRVIAQAGSNQVSFAAVGLSDTLGGNLDNVRLSAATQSNAAANDVPEPGSLALCVAALGSLLLLRRASRERAVQRPLRQRI